MTRQFCREKLSKNEDIYGKIRHCVTKDTAGGIYLRPLKVLLPFEGVLTLSSKVVNVILEYQLENIVFTDAIGRIRMPDRITQKGQTGQRKIILEGFEEKETRIGENHPQFLPTIGTFELAQEVAG